MSMSSAQENTMSYLPEFKRLITSQNYSSFLNLWDEYCQGDQIDPQEYLEILQSVKASAFAESFGRHAEKGITIWELLPNSETKHMVLKLLFDLQTTQSKTLAEIGYNYLKENFGDSKDFLEKIRLIGLRNKEKFQGAISAFDLLTHMQKGNFVYHNGGWGTGEITEISLLREQLFLEFELVSGKRELSFENAFRSLTPLKSDHFLSLRFGHPETLEKLAKDDAAQLIRMILKDLGPKTASEIKEELCEFIIEPKEWSKWWQATRAKIKKDTQIQTPEDVKDPYLLRREQLSHESRFRTQLEVIQKPKELVVAIYSFMRDHADSVKNAAFKEELLARLQKIEEEITPAGARLELLFLESDLGDKNALSKIETLLKAEPSAKLLEQISILAMQKRALVELLKLHQNNKALFEGLLFEVEHNTLRDYILQDVLMKEKGHGKATLEKILQSKVANPDLFLWYFQKIIQDKELPFGDSKGQVLWFEHFLILLSEIGGKPEWKERVKKMLTLLTANRYSLVRQIFQETNDKEIQEFLLLTSKCYCLSDHDIKIFQSLAEVVHPSLAKHNKSKSDQPEEVIWCTQSGYDKLKKRIEQIATVETVENAREIEIARSHGDLRENSEFKFALEKRDRLQGELKLLSSQINKARIITQDDIEHSSVGIGAEVHCTSGKGEAIIYTILGPWEADPDQNILSFQSKLALAMKGLKKGDSFLFQGQTYIIKAINPTLRI